jgi:ABC-type uncharacterized transport system permease subunit
MNKYLSYIKERIIISLKSFVEYKSNFYATFIVDIFNFTIVLTFYFVYIGVIESSILNWTLVNFFLFFLFTNLTTKANNLFYFWEFREVLLRGDLNLHITKPISPYIAIMLNGLKSGRFVTTMIVLLITLFTISLTPTQNHFEAVILYIIGFIGTIYLANLFQIFGFFMKGKSQIQKIRGNSKIITKNFTFAPFENNFTISSILFLLLPQSLIAYLVTNILIGNIKYFTNYFLALTIYTIIIVIVNLTLWHYGLKKYEAFG